MLAGPWVQYDRKIRYLDYLENGQRCQGAGFIKLERRDELCNISLQVSGLYRKDRFTRPFLLIGENGEKELCKLQLSDGGIKTCFEGLDSGNLGGQDISYDRLLGIRIPVADGKEIRCIWRRLPDVAEIGEENVGDAVEKAEEKAKEKAEETAEGKAVDAVEIAEEKAKEKAEEKAEEIAEEKPKGKAEEKAEGKAVDAVEKAGEKAKEKAVDAEEKPGEKSETAAQKSESGMYKEDKWQQLWMIYPHVHPFCDEREFLSISPGDFVLLHRQSYKLVNNSFLLHGFYQYHHLILMAESSRGQAKYYIGVPGTLYERDKKTAILYGFESFECAKEPAEEGDFGYYMVPVEL